MTTNAIFRTYAQGQRAPITGMYELVNPDGKKTGESRRFVRGEPLRKTPDSTQRYTLVNIED